MPGQRFTIVTISYDQVIQVTFSSQSAKLTLAHCDQVFITLSPDVWLTRELMLQIGHKVYQHCLKKNDSFVALLEVIVLPTNECGKPLYKYVNYCHLVGVISLPGQSNLICTLLTDNSLLKPEMKCFELVEDKCQARPYHMISSYQSLANLKCLLVQPHGWLLVVNRSNVTSSRLLIASQYIVFSSERKLHFANNKIAPSIMHSKSHLPNEVLADGQGLSIKYGAILSGSLQQKQKNAHSPSHRNQYLFTGEFASPLLNFAHIQQRLNLSYSFNEDSAWPELPKSSGGSVKDGGETKQSISSDLDEEGGKLEPEDGEQACLNSSSQMEPSEEITPCATLLGEEPQFGGELQNLALPCTCCPQQVIYVNSWDYNSQQLYECPMAGQYCYYSQPQVTFYEPYNEAKHSRAANSNSIL